MVNINANLVKEPEFINFERERLNRIQSAILGLIINQE